MKNREFLDICYKYMNRFINSDELINQLSNINKNKLNENEIKEINELIKEIREISNSIPDIEDELVKTEKANAPKKALRSLRGIFYIR